MYQTWYVAFLKVSLLFVPRKREHRLQTSSSDAGNFSFLCSSSHACFPTSRRVSLGASVLQLLTYHCGYTIYENFPNFQSARCQSCLENRLQSIGSLRVGHNWAASLSLSIFNLVFFSPRSCKILTFLG